MAAAASLDELAAGEAVRTAIAVLQQHFGNRLSTAEAMRAQHANTLTWLPSQLPDAVVFAERTEDVAQVVETCRHYRVPIIAFGSGTSLEGHVNAPRGGISLDLSRMSRVIEVNAQDLDCRVEAGITRGALNRHLKDTGLFFSVDPGTEEATIGGMAATRASGTMAVRYGTMRDNVLSVTAVMADGSTVTTARRARKSSAGYDLTRLLVGSEGTLGIITELNVRLHGVPEATLAAVCPFQSIDGACNAVIAAIQLGLGLARVELLDPLQIRACNAHSNLTLQELPTLFLEFHGTPQGTREQVEIFGEIARGEGAQDFHWAEQAEDKSRLWKARHDAYWAGRELRPGTQAVATDVCVPISRLAECVTQTQEDILRFGLIAPIVGHVGDGNFHVLPLVDMANAAEVATVEKFIKRLVERALAMDGTCTGEHGVGTGKLAYMQAEHGSGLDVMRQIKIALDPLGILNPGKVIPAAG